MTKTFWYSCVCIPTMKSSSLSYYTCAIKYILNCMLSCLGHDAKKKILQLKKKHTNTEINPSDMSELCIPMIWTSLKSLAFKSHLDSACFCDMYCLKTKETLLESYLTSFYFAQMKICALLKYSIANKDSILPNPQVSLLPCKNAGSHNSYYLLTFQSLISACLQITTFHPRLNLPDYYSMQMKNKQI